MIRIFNNLSSKNTTYYVKYTLSNIGYEIYISHGDYNIGYIDTREVN